MANQHLNGIRPATSRGLIDLPAIMLRKRRAHSARRSGLIGVLLALALAAACTPGPGGGGPPAPTVPSAPAISSANPEGSDAIVTFTQAGNGGSPITNYEYQVNSGPWTPFAPPAVTSPATVPGVVVGDDIAIRAVNAIGPSAASNVATWDLLERGIFQYTGGSPANPPVGVDIGGVHAGTGSFTGFAFHSGRALFQGSSLPADLTQFDLVLLPLQTVAFSASEVASLDAYMSGGGTVLAIGDRGTGVDNYSASNAVMNALATGLGSTMQLVNGSVAQTNDITMDIPSSPFSAGVTSVRYRNASSITLGASGIPVVESDTSAVLVGAQSVGAGWFVLSGDANTWSDYTLPTSGGRIDSATHTTTQLVKNLIGNGGGTAPGPQVFHYLGNSPAMGLITTNAPDGAVYGSPATGGGRYTQFATALGAGVFMSDTLPPAGLESYVATLLPSHQSAFTGPSSTPGTQLAVLSDYLAHGRTLFALADGALATTVRATMDALATGLGSTLQHGGGQHNVDGAASTSQVNGASPFAASVTSLAYYIPGDIVGFIGDEWIVKRQTPYTQTILAAQEIGGGRFVYSGDNGLFADGQAHRWGTHDNAVLINNLI